MALSYPNRTGEVGIYNSVGTITLPGTAALPGLRTFAAAASAGKLAADDHLGLHIKRSGNDAIWRVSMAQYSSGTLTILETEDSAGMLSDGDQVDVTAVITAKMLDSAGLSYAPPSQTGPEWWIIQSSGTTWNATTEEYTFNADYGLCLSHVTTGVNANWGTGLNPTLITLEIWLPEDGSDMDWEYAQLVVTSDTGCSSIEASGGSIGSGITGGQWVELSVDESWGLDSVTDLIGLGLSGAYNNSIAYKVRNINVTPTP